MTTPLRDLILEYFKEHPNQELEHGPVVDWATDQWLREHDTPPRDPWRSIRALHQDCRRSKWRVVINGKNTATN